MTGPRPTLRFDFEWRTTLFVVVMAPALLGLGFWQLARADEKAELEASWDMRQNQPPVAIGTLTDRSPERLSYLPVLISGEFLPEQYFLLDNRMLGGVFGYEVLGLVRLRDNSGLVLVNRGWLRGDPARRELPQVPSVTGVVDIEGHIYIAPGAPYLLAEQQLDGDWPKLLQAVEMNKIVPQVEQLAQGPVFPYIVRTKADEPGALAIDWQLINVSPDKHRAYAVQWFTMALVLLVFFLLRSSNIWQWIRRPRGSNAG